MYNISTSNNKSNIKAPGIHDAVGIDLAAAFSGADRIRSAVVDNPTNHGLDMVQILLIRLDETDLARDVGRVFSIKRGGCRRHIDSHTGFTGSCPPDYGVSGLASMTAGLHAEDENEGQFDHSCGQRGNIYLPGT